jgi:tetratricopeptide (TPR) repeat protein
MRGLLAQQQEEYDVAEQLFQDALVIRRDLKNEKLIAIAINSLGGLEHERKQYDKAEQHYREALALAEKQNLKEPQAYISGNLGLLAFDHERWTEAREWFEKALQLAREVGRQDLIASDLDGLARVNEAEGHPDLALSLAQEALKIFERLRESREAGTRELVERLRKKVATGNS